MRDWQGRTSQWLQGKVFPSSTPIGPFLVSPDEVDGAADLRLVTEVNGQVMQDGRTSDLVFGPAAVASYISQFTPLGPGDMILTGTPSGVGAARSPQIFLSPGDVLRTSIEGLGECVNRCVADR
jgi:acylpyruvate hydrolase